MNKKILFISHESSRTGAPVVLLSLLKWFKENTDLSFDILVLLDGPLRKDFEAVAKTYFIPDVHSFTLINKIKRRLHPEKTDEYKLAEVVKRLAKNNYHTIFGNTIVTLPWLLQFKKLQDVKLVCAIHELPYIIDLFLKQDLISVGLKQLDLILAGSHAVKENLLKEYSLSKEKVTVAHAFIEKSFSINKSSIVLKQELNITDELVIGAMGSVFDLRKGIDLIVPLAIELKKNYPEIKFKLIWVGGTATDRIIKLLKHDVSKCGLEDNVIFISNTEYPDDYINLYDVFLLLSREDPFPLVLLTAAYMEKAAIAFDNSGGAPELLNNGAGFIEPYLDVHSVAKTISVLYHNPEMMKETGKKAREKVEKEFSSNVIPAKVLECLRNI